MPNIFIWFPASHYIYISLSVSEVFTCYWLVACKATQNFQAASDATRISRMHVTCQRTSYLVFSCSERGKTRTYSLIWPAQRSLGSLFSELYSSWKRLFQIMEYEQCSSLLKQRKIDQQNAESPDVLFPKIRWSKEDNYIRAACCLYTMAVFRSVKWW